MTYFRVQPYPASDLLHGPRTTTFWSDDADDLITVPGVAVCTSLEGLVAYLVGSGATWGYGWTLVELEGTPTGQEAEDAELGVLYVHPTRIVSTEPAVLRLVPMADPVS